MVFARVWLSMILSPEIKSQNPTTRGLWNAKARGVVLSINQLSFQSP